MPRRTAFLLEEVSAPSPGQQLLDRFLGGYPRDGVYRRPEVGEVTAFLMSGRESDFGPRANDWDLRIASSAEQALENADAVVIASRKPGAVAQERFLDLTLDRAAPGAACFVHGALSNSLAAARAAVKKAEARSIALLAGTPTAVTWRQPEWDLPADTRLTEALIVVQINTPASNSPAIPGPGMLAGAELHALDGLLPVLERRRGSESGVRAVRWIEGKEVWRAGDKGLWSWPLLAAAVSRSHSPQGDPMLDGRTQDIAGLGLIPKLAKNPVGWLLEHRDGLRTALLVLDGVIGDWVFAVRTADRAIHSTQLFRAPPPMEQHFSRLAAVIEDFFLTRNTPWPLQRSLLTASLLEAFRAPATRSGRWVKVPST